MDPGLEQRIKEWVALTAKMEECRSRRQRLEADILEAIHKQGLEKTKIRMSSGTVLQFRNSATQQFLSQRFLLDGLKAVVEQFHLNVEGEKLLKAILARRTVKNAWKIILINSIQDVK